MSGDKKRVLIFGGTGFLGLNLAEALTARDYESVLISRNKPKKEIQWKHHIWDVQNIGDWVEDLDGAHAVVNLAGRTVDCIKTPEHCDEILRSRVDSTLLIGKALRQIEDHPPVWVQMSTAHIYGDPPSLRCDEDSSFGYGLAPDVGRAWEQACAEAVPDAMRQVVLRTSFVLGKSGGALSTLALLARIGLGGRVGSGTQGMSWIHENDMNTLFLRAIEEESMSGAYVATAPNPVSQKEFMRSLRKAVDMPIGLPAFAWMVRIGAPLFFNTDPELALYGRYCVSRRLAEENFEFQFSEIDDALSNIYK